MMHFLRPIFKSFVVYGTLLFLTGCALPAPDFVDLRGGKQACILRSKYFPNDIEHPPTCFEAELVPELAGTRSAKSIGMRIANSGFQPGNLYHFYETKVNNKSTYIGDLIANSAGKLVCQMPKPCLLEDFKFSINGLMPGEELAYTIASATDFKCQTTCIAQTPLCTTGNDGATLKVRMASENADIFFMHAQGLKPFEKLYSISKSCGEERTFSCVADKQGGLVAMVAPSVIGQAGGVASIEIIRENKETLKLEYFWGTEAVYRAAF